MGAHLARWNRCALFAGMGSGKTLVTLDLLSLGGQLDEAPALVIAPKRVAQTVWPQEAGKWPHLRGLKVECVVGSESQRLAALSRQADVYSVNYDVLPWLVLHYGAKWPFRTIIADELTRLRSYRARQGGRRAAALARVAHTPTVRTFVGLTGTPTPNGILSLWGQMWFVDRGERLGRTFSAFAQRWFYPDQSGYGLVPVPGAQEEIQERIRDICLSVNPRDYMGIPEPIVTDIRVELPASVRKVYREMERKLWAELSDGTMLEAVHAAARSIKCLQIANGTVYTDEERAVWQALHGAKIEALESIVEEANGMPVLVAYQFRHDLARLLKAFPGSVDFGSTPDAEARWNAGQIPVMFVHPASAGHGCNLQWGGNILAFYGHWWNTEEREQVIERIGPVRQFQAELHRPVFIYNIVADKTVDDIVLKRHATRRDVQELLIEALKGTVCGG
jgi:SNF2 family DNA or RNA helicase